VLSPDDSPAVAPSLPSPHDSSAVASALLKYFQVDRFSASVFRALSSPLAQGLLVDSGGVPRVLEFLFRHAERPDNHLRLTRDMLLDRLVPNPRIERLGGANTAVAAAAEATLLVLQSRLNDCVRS
jgi:hypothetical protein